MGLHNIEDQVATVVHSSACELVKTPLSARRKVQFADEVSYAEGMKEEEIEPAFIWYTQAEYDNFRATNLAILREQKESGFVETDDWTPRGFEYVLQRYSRKAVRIEHASRVLEFSKNLYVDCPSVLADYAASSSSTCGCVERARTIGASDEIEARGIHWPRSNKIERTARALPLERVRKGSFSKVKKFFRCN